MHFAWCLLFAFILLSCACCRADAKFVFYKLEICDYSTPLCTGSALHCETFNPNSCQYDPPGSFEANIDDILVYSNTACSGTPLARYQTGRCISLGSSYSMDVQVKGGIDLGLFLFLVIGIPIIIAIIVFFVVRKYRGKKFDCEKNIEDECIKISNDCGCPRTQHPDLPMEHIYTLLYHYDGIDIWSSLNQVKETDILTIIQDQLMLPECNQKVLFHSPISISSIQDLMTAIRMKQDHLDKDQKPMDDHLI